MYFYYAYVADYLSLSDLQNSSKIYFFTLNPDESFFWN